MEVQKTILKQNQVGQSLYIQNIAALNNTINNKNEGIKYDSYQRYLLKKKGLVFSNQEKNKAESPKYGNKISSTNISSKSNKCDFCQ